jgi:hypothetical protein
MAHPVVVDSRYVLHIWRVAVNILNKQLQTADKGWSSSWLLGEGLITPHHITPACYEVLHRASELDEFFGMIRHLKQALLFFCFTIVIFVQKFFYMSAVQDVLNNFHIQQTAINVLNTS